LDTNDYEKFEEHPSVKIPSDIMKKLKQHTQTKPIKEFNVEK
jgi:hypothetical protein